MDLMETAKTFRSNRISLRVFYTLCILNPVNAFTHAYSYTGGRRDTE